MLLAEVLIIAVSLAIWLSCLIEILLTRNPRTRRLNKGWWLAIVLLFGLAGAIAWLVAGRPRRAGPRQPGGSRRWSAATPGGLGPDDDPEFLARIRVPSPEERELLSWWEADLERPGDDRSQGDPRGGA